MSNLMQPLTYTEYRTFLQGTNKEYYKGRWEYYKEVIKITKTEKYNNVIELGPGFVPIIKNGDIIINPLDDQFGKPDGGYGEIFKFDATIKPWPIKNKQYDLFIALQVWEHLDNKQTRAFKEVIRISKKAILSFPYEWDGGEEKPSHRAHRDIDLDLIKDWTLNVTPKKIIKIKRTGTEFSKGPRLICFWDFTGQ
jgi:hypothetical protein